MPVVRHPDELPAHRGPGWTELAWAGAATFGTAVPMEARRCVIDPGAAGRAMRLGAQEALVYVAAGGGTAEACGEHFPLEPESVLWLASCDEVSLRAGAEGLDALVAESAGPAGQAGAVLAKVFAAGELPHLVSTRDTRDRLDLVTDDVPVGARRIRADRIIYHPGDTAAAHYHADCQHVFCVLTGSGLMHTDQAASRLEAGMSALVGPGEVHWFENDTGANFSFVEFWAPPPTDTVWTVTGDRCTWAPSR
jgi:mannose-6-phosphate isomerase-like protein (cupin superfamily)